MPSLAFYQPDIPQNVGAAMRLCACLGVGMHVIEPTTFAWKDKEFRRTGMDYISHLNLTKHASWEKFLAARGTSRLVLIETDTSTSLWDFKFKADDILILGKESAGVPPEVIQAADATVYIPMVAGVRSLNVVTAAAIACGEALRQTHAER